MAMYGNVWYVDLSLLLLGGAAMTKSTTIYLNDRQQEELNLLKDATGLSIAFLIRRGIDIILKENKVIISKQKNLKYEDK